MYLDDFTNAELKELGPRAGATAGTPVEYGLAIHDDGIARSGVWECTPGEFPSQRDGITEVMTILSGEGTLHDEDGTERAVRPGAVIVVTDGWRGRWVIRETVRKTYTVVKTK
jgi:uncharacterized cupin superfamily protein